jgi:hypothetical protein
MAVSVMNVRERFDNDFVFVRHDATPDSNVIDH